MSEDIVARLRSPATVFYEYDADNGDLLDAAADEIERLRAVIGKAVEFLVQMELEDEITSASPLRMTLALALKGDGDE